MFIPGVSFANDIYTDSGLGSANTVNNRYGYRFLATFPILKVSAWFYKKMVGCGR
jgi:hypothetical protein